MDKDLTERVLLMEDRYNEVMRVLAALDEAVADMRTSRANSTC